MLAVSKDSRHSTPFLELVLYTQLAYTITMNAVFIELPAFERHRDDYLDDDGFTRLQIALMVDPAAGDVIEVAVHSVRQG